mmetsp:Transcript_9287/g.27965  ORF Transcript_9287/g.27965 Transcript_9287/m.27965 type:complete len:206 (+) Transcript_9287:108-725(+)
MESSADRASDVSWEFGVSDEMLPRDIMGWMWVRSSFGKKKRYFRFVNGVLTKHVCENAPASLRVDLSYADVQFNMDKSLLLVVTSTDEVVIYPDSHEQGLRWYRTMSKSQRNRNINHDYSGLNRLFALKKPDLYKVLKKQPHLHRWHSGRPFSESGSTSECSTSSSWASKSSERSEERRKWTGFSGVWDPRRCRTSSGESGLASR